MMIKTMDNFSLQQLFISYKHDKCQLPVTICLTGFSKEIYFADFQANKNLDDYTNYSHI